MPRQAKQIDSEERVHEARHNGISEPQLKGFVSEYENEQAEIDAIMERARTDCQPHVDQMKAIAKEAAEAGIEKKAFKAKIRERALRRKADGCRSVLSERQQDVFDEISVKLGDLAESIGPLGKAALEAHLGNGA